MYTGQFCLLPEFGLGKQHGNSTVKTAPGGHRDKNIHLPCFGYARYSKINLTILAFSVGLNLVLLFNSLQMGPLDYRAV